MSRGTILMISGIKRHITLNPSTISNLPVYYACFGDLNWRRAYGVLSEPFVIDDYIRAVAISQYPGVYRYIVYNDNVPAGFAHICKPEDSNRCEITGGLTPQFIGTGIGRPTLRILVDLCFFSLGAHRIQCTVAKYNAPSLNLLRRFGFAVEGELREYGYDVEAGTYHNFYVLGLLPHDKRVSE